jgi:hypothetical protein
MPVIKMIHWKAATTFGDEVVDRVLNDPHWREQYPELYEQLDSPNKRTRFDAILPEAMVLEMAKDGIYAYYAHPDGERLYCYGFKDDLEDKESLPGYLSGLEAILAYGSECVFKATDTNVGYKSRDVFVE